MTGVETPKNNEVQTTGPEVSEEEVKKLNVPDPAKLATNLDKTIVDPKETSPNIEKEKIIDSFTIAVNSTNGIPYDTNVLTVNKAKELPPALYRFSSPSRCSVEQHEQYREWKNTVGPLQEKLKGLVKYINENANGVGSNSGIDGFILPQIKTTGQTPDSNTRDTLVGLKKYPPNVLEIAINAHNQANPNNIFTTENINTLKNILTQDNYTSYDGEVSTKTRDKITPVTITLTPEKNQYDIGNLNIPIDIDARKIKREEIIDNEPSASIQKIVVKGSADATPVSPEGEAKAQETLKVYLDKLNDQKFDFSLITLNSPQFNNWLIDQGYVSGQKDIDAKPLQPNEYFAITRAVMQLVCLPQGLIQDPDLKKKLDFSYETATEIGEQYTVSDISVVMNKNIVEKKSEVTEPKESKEDKGMEQEMNFYVATKPSGDSVISPNTFLGGFFSKVVVGADGKAKEEVSYDKKTEGGRARNKTAITHTNGKFGEDKNITSYEKGGSYYLYIPEDFVTNPIVEKIYNFKEGKGDAPTTEELLSLYTQLSAAYPNKSINKELGTFAQKQRGNLPIEQTASTGQVL